MKRLSIYLLLSGLLLTTSHILKADETPEQNLLLQDEVNTCLEEELGRHKDRNPMQVIYFCAVEVNGKVLPLIQGLAKISADSQRGIMIPGVSINVSPTCADTSAVTQAECRIGALGIQSTPYAVPSTKITSPLGAWAIIVE